MTTDSEKQRTFTFNVPGDQDEDWYFRFDCAFSWNGADETTIVIYEDVLGQAVVRVQDCGVTWTSLFVAWNFCHNWAVRQALEWECSRGPGA
jgi:hypothetical protein